MSERKEEKTVTVAVESQGHVNGAPETKSAKDQGRNVDEAPAKADKNQKH
jgi:hypothetical protein